MLASSRIASIFNLIRYYEIHLITFYPNKYILALYFNLLIVLNMNSVIGTR